MKLELLFLDLFCGSGTRISAKCVMAFRMCHKSTCFVEKKRRRDRTQEATQLRLVPKNGVETERNRLLSYASCLKNGVETERKRLLSYASCLKLRYLPVESPKVRITIHHNSNLTCNSSMYGTRALSISTLATCKGRISLGRLSFPSDVTGAAKPITTAEFPRSIRCFDVSKSSGRLGRSDAYWR